MKLSPKIQNKAWSLIPPVYRSMAIQICAVAEKNGVERMSFVIQPITAHENPQSRAWNGYSFKFSKVNKGTAKLETDFQLQVLAEINPEDGDPMGQY